MAAGNLPDFNVYLGDKYIREGKNKKRFVKVGAAWWSRNGKGLMITLNPGTTIDTALLEKFTFGMFENEDKNPDAPKTGSYPEEGNDDIPF